MEFQAFLGIAVPFLGTALGAALVFFTKNISYKVSSALGGFAGGVMIAASVFSLLIPAMEWSVGLGVLSFLPASVGFIFGAGFFLAFDSLILRMGKTTKISDKSGIFGKNAMLTLAVSMHNLPEGVAVGVVYAWLLSGTGDVSVASALALSVGVAVQNFPEGAIISLPAKAEGMSGFKSFMLGVMSAAVETLGALFAIVLTELFLPALPYLLGFAAGAMIYVVVKELIPEATLCGHTLEAAVSFTFGFLIMMLLDVALG